MLGKKVVNGVLGLTAVAALFAAITVQAQTSATDTGRQSTTGPATSGQSGSSGQSDQSGQSGSSGQSGQSGSSGQAGQTGTGATGGMEGATGTGATASGAGAMALNSSDRRMLLSMAQANMAEIEAGRMAQTKSQNEQVKNFAQQMIDDHTKALEDVRQLAQSKNVTLPTDLDRTHKAKANKLQSLSGEAFDRAYLAQAGVSDHKKHHAMLKKAQSRARDPDLKALAARTLPAVGQHLSTVQQLHKNTAHGSSKAQGQTGSSPEKR